MKRKLALGVGVAGLVCAGMLAVGLVLLPGMMELAATPERVAAYYADLGVPAPELRVTPGPERSVAYAVAGPEDAPGVVFIHGSPGTWWAWRAFLADPKLAHLRRVAIDRPGYGGSGSGKVLPSLPAQAAHAAAVLRAAFRGPAVVVGHSLGGPIAGRLAMDEPDLVRGLVLVAASVDPSLEKTQWFQYVARWPVLSALVPRDLAVCNLEIMAVVFDLRAMEPRWSELELPVVVIQGLADTLVPPGNADYLEARLKGAINLRREPNMGHFVPWNRPELIVGAVLDLAGESKRSAQ